MAVHLYTRLDSKTAQRAIGRLYGAENSQRQLRRYKALAKKFIERFAGEDFSFFSTSGRTELIGNHTDHNYGMVLAGSVQLDTVCAAQKTDDLRVCIVSEGFEHEFCVDLNSLDADVKERGTTEALIRGIARRFADAGYEIGGFNAYVLSDVLRGSGLSSSAAIEILICTVFSELYNGGAMEPMEMAKISQWAENVYFGKPCGLMDQLACAWGGIIGIDFRDPQNPEVTPIKFDFQKNGYSMVITDVHADHADLTGEYAAITEEMHEVAAYFGKEKLRQVEEKTFFCSLGELYGAVSDRAILRAIHFYEENNRALAAAEALRKGRLQEFFNAVNASGESSWCKLQNLYPAGAKAQAIPVALAAAQHILAGKGACRVHGGGFGGTIEAFVPVEIKSAYMNEMNRIFGGGSSIELEIRQCRTMKLEL